MNNKLFIYSAFLCSLFFIKTEHSNAMKTEGLNKNLLHPNNFENELITFYNDSETNISLKWYYFYKENQTLQEINNKNFIVEKNASKDLEYPVEDKNGNGSIVIAFTDEENKNILEQSEINIPQDNLNYKLITKEEILISITDGFLWRFGNMVDKFSKIVKKNLQLEKPFMVWNNTPNNINAKLYHTQKQSDINPSPLKFEAVGQAVTITKNKIGTFYVPYTLKDNYLALACAENSLHLPAKLNNLKNLTLFHEIKRIQQYNSSLNPWANIKTKITGVKTLRSHYIGINQNKETKKYFVEPVNPRNILGLPDIDAPELKDLSQQLIDGSWWFNNKGLIENGVKPEVRTGATISKKEEEYLLNRTIYIQDHKTEGIEKLLERKLDNFEKIPTIALVFTGGGYRAMTQTIGFLQGAQEIGLLDSASYMTGLSGSTWALTSFVESGKNIDEFSENMKIKVSSLKNLYLFSNEQDSIDYQKSLLIKFYNNMEHGPIGMYGASLANALFDGFKQTKSLSNLQHTIEKNHQYPFPIMTALDAAIDQEHLNSLQFQQSLIYNNNRMTWYEFNPYEIGTFSYGGKWIDTNFMGSIFNNKQLITPLPEYPLSFYLGIWGSAFAITKEEIWDALDQETKNKILEHKEKAINISAGAIAGSIITALGLTATLPLWGTALLTAGVGGVLAYGGNKAINALWAENKRLVCATLPNFSTGIKNDPDYNRDKLIFVDGGHLLLSNDQEKKVTYRHNFSSVPALERKVDILIMCDSERETEKIDHLVASSLQAQELNIKFPQLTQERIASCKKEVSTLLADEEGPIVIYMQAKKNDKFNKKLTKTQYDPATNKATETTNFAYSGEEYSFATGLTKEIMIQSKDTIKKAIKIALERSATRSHINSSNSVLQKDFINKINEIESLKSNLDKKNQENNNYGTLLQILDQINQTQSDQLTIEQLSRLKALKITKEKSPAMAKYCANLMQKNNIEIKNLEKDVLQKKQELERIRQSNNNVDTQKTIMIEQQPNSISKSISPNTEDLSATTISKPTIQKMIQIVKDALNKLETLITY